MAEIGGRGEIPDAEDGDLVPGAVGEEADGEGGVAVGGLVEGGGGDRGSGGEVGEGVAGGAPPTDLGGAGKHVEFTDGEGAAVEDADDAAELVLGHGEVGFEAGEGGVVRAGRISGGDTSGGGDQEEEKSDRRHRIAGTEMPIGG